MSEFVLSECGKYICRHLQGIANYEAWTVDGSTYWRHDDRVKTWEDARKRRHPYEYSVGGWSCRKPKQKPGSFTLNLLHYDRRKYIKPLTGNTIIESIYVVFRRKVPSGHTRAWVRRLGTW